MKYLIFKIEIRSRELVGEYCFQNSFTSADFLSEHTLTVDQKLPKQAAEYPVEPFSLWAEFVGIAEGRRIRSKLEVE